MKLKGHRGEQTDRHELGRDQRSNAQGQSKYCAPRGRGLDCLMFRCRANAHGVARYCSSVTCSSQSTFLPSLASWIAICVTAVLSVAPCQCFLPLGHVTTSPGRISNFSSPQHWVHPRPVVTISVWPQGCVCHAERAPGSNVTAAPPNCAGPGDWNRCSTRTLPVKHSVGPAWEGCEPLRLISMESF